MLNLSKYKLIIFDWDGTLVDSASAYEEWDKRYLEKFYNVSLPVEYFEDLNSTMKSIDPGRSEDIYFRYLDKTYGRGDKSLEAIWNDLFSLSPEIQHKVHYKQNAVNVLKKLRLSVKAKIALATNSERRDMIYYSSKESSTAKELSPTDYFDTIITRDDVTHLKPHPESYQKVIDHFSVKPSEVLVFEDSEHGIAAAKATGANVVLLNDTTKSSRLVGIADYAVKNWEEVINLLNL